MLTNPTAHALTFPNRSSETVSARVRDVHQLGLEFVLVVQYVEGKRNVDESHSSPTYISKLQLLLEEFFVNMQRSGQCFVHRSVGLYFDILREVTELYLMDICFEKPLFLMSVV